MNIILLLLFLNPGQTWVEYDTVCVGSEIKFYNSISGDGDYIWLISTGSEEPVVYETPEEEVSLFMPESGYLWVCRAIRNGNEIIQGNAHVISIHPFCHEKEIAKRDLEILNQDAEIRNLEKRLNNLTRAINECRGAIAY